MEITIIRGTTNSFGIVLKDSTGADYVLQAGETLRFGVKSNRDNTSYDIVKNMTSSDYSEGKYHFTVAASDTENLACGRYFYDIGLQTGSSTYFNVVACNFFNVNYNVTQRETV